MWGERLGLVNRVASKGEVAGPGRVHKPVVCLISWAPSNPRKNDAPKKASFRNLERTWCSRDAFCRPWSGAARADYRPVQAAFT